MRVINITPTISFQDRLIAENRQTVIPDILSTLQKNLKLNNGGLGFFVGNEVCDVVEHGIKWYKVLPEIFHLSFL